MAKAVIPHYFLEDGTEIFCVEAISFLNPRNIWYYDIDIGEMWIMCNVDLQVIYE